MTNADIRLGNDLDPVAIAYNRLEVSPRSSDHARSSQAEIRDPLWMLSRQWQVGEFNAEDGGTALKIKVVSNRQRMNKIIAGGDFSSLGDGVGVPLEYAVEMGKRSPDLLFRIEAGKLFHSILREKPVLEEQIWGNFLETFGIGITLNLNSSLEDSATRALYNSIKDKVIDGHALFSIITSGNVFATWLLTVTQDPDLRDALLIIGDIYKSAYNHFYSKHDKLNGIWAPDRMEYQFSVEGQNSVLNVDQYSQGRLDWFHFDLKNNQADDIRLDQVDTLFPGPVNYKGAPRDRWWEMEDHVINFGKVPMRKTDLLTMILIDFALIYGNDWLLLPFPMEINSLCRIKGMLVTDVFGFHTLIPPAQPGTDAAWSLFQLSQNGDRKNPESLLYLAPSLLKNQENEPLEKVTFQRDEMSNLVWAFEQIIPDLFGNGLNTLEKENQKAASVPDASGLPKYFLATDIPSYQIPFIPVHLPGNVSQIRLQRARMPNGNSDSGPRSLLLTEAPAPFYIREEEVPRQGIVVSRNWQRTRWVNGQTFVWIGRKKETGKKEMSSSLAFDQVK